MRVARNQAALKKFLKAFKSRKETLGFVPTLGYLHEGHLSLVRRAKKENDRVVVSIFVNPLQFGPKEDFARYPRDSRRDLKLLKKQNVDVVYLPNEENFYSPSFETRVSVVRIGRVLCGASRPHHFAGVATAVLKLLNQVSPDVLYLGKKDHQQCRVIQRMAEDLDVPVQVRVCPIVREKDGLAMSSRNYYLDAQERMQAGYLNQALAEAEAAIRQGVRNVKKIKTTMQKTLNLATRGKLDYAEIVDAATLQPVVQLKKGQKIELALAVFFSKTRLIDNRIIKINQ